MQIMLCDGNEKELELLRKKIASCAQTQGVNVGVRCFDTVQKLAFDLEDVADQVDLIYINISTEPELGGAQLVEQIRDLGCIAEIVFLSSEEQRWPEGYDAGAFHYLVQGEGMADKFERVFLRVVEKIAAKKRKVIAFSYAGERAVIPIADITYFKSEGRMICVHYQADKTFEFYSRMNKIENTLFSEGFLRVHKSYLVNKDCIQNVKGTMIVLFDKTEIPVSRAMVATLRDMLAKNVN